MVPKKSNVTGAIASIKSADIENIPGGKPEQVLQGRAAGVSVVTNSGQPGSSATIRIRGLTSFGAGGNDPMWVVDGIIVDGIGWLSQSDIESIEVLKDGASSAIYGVSAARGVVLVTTKKGKKER
jgi:TonB-dependent SusC/RagA subfamily outer membrane receptor